MASVVTENVNVPTSSIGSNGRQHTKTFQVTVDTVNDSWEAVTASGIPAYGEVHPDDLSAVVVDISSQETGSRNIFHVVVTYETQTRNFVLSNNPLDDPVDIDWAFQAYEVALELDVGGFPIVNSAGDAFDPPYTTDRFHPVVTIVRNEATFNPTTALSKQGKLNSDGVRIAGLTISPGEGKLTDYAGRRAFRNGRTYWVVTYRIEFSDDKDADNVVIGWTREMYDHGIYSKPVAGADNRTRIQDDDTPPKDVVVPHALDGAGEKGDAKTPVYILYDVFETTTFAPLGLDIRL